MTLQRNKSADFWYHPDYTGIVMRHQSGFAVYREGKLVVYGTFEEAEKAYFKAGRLVN